MVTPIIFELKMYVHSIAAQIAGPDTMDTFPVIETSQMEIKSHRIWYV